MSVAALLQHSPLDMDDEEKVSSATLHTPDTIKPHIDKSDVETTKEVVLEWSENDPEVSVLCPWRN